METNAVITHILELVAGIGTFMVACETMSSNLQAISSSKLKELFSKVSNNKLIGVVIGALTTAAIQSSSATIVLVIGFVNAGIISLSQATCIIFGSEIGTTLTGQIVALGMIPQNTISTSTLFASFVGIGVVWEMMIKKETTKKISGIMIGFGMIFVGLSMMSASMNSFAELEILKDFMASIKSSVVLIVIGALVTAIIQSSSAMTTIAITMICSGLINLEQGIYITLGANVGTCITGALAALSSKTNAKRTSLIQLIFNIGGVVILAVIDFIIKSVSGNTASVSHLFLTMFPDVPHTQLAMFHTFFNIASVLVALPISELFVSSATKLIKDGEDLNSRLQYFDQKMMSSPAIAVAQLKKEVINMSHIAIDNFNIAITAVSKLDFSQKEHFEENEEQLDYLSSRLVQIVYELSKITINTKDYAYLSSAYRTINDFERIGDYAENILRYGEHLSQLEQTFSEEAKAEIARIEKEVNELYRVSILIYENFDEKEYNQTQSIKKEIDYMLDQMASNHIRRMNKGECNAEVGNQYLQLSSDIERIADHLMNINEKELVLAH